MISDQNCTTQGSITTLLHPFSNCPNTGLVQFKYFIDAVLSQFEIKFIQFGWGGGEGRGDESFGNNSCKICHMILCFSFSCNLIGYFKQALKSGQLFCFWCSLLIGWEKRCNLKQKMVRLVNKWHQLEPIRLQRPPVISE